MITAPIDMFSVRAVDRTELYSHPDYDKEKKTLSFDHPLDVQIDHQGNIFPRIEPQQIKLTLELGPDLSYYYTLRVYDSKILNISVDTILQFEGEKK